MENKKAAAAFYLTRLQKCLSFSVFLLIVPQFVFLCWLNKAVTPWVQWVVNMFKASLCQNNPQNLTIT